MVLGHGAGGGIDAPDLLAVRAALPPIGIAVAAVTQPYRVAGRRAPDAAAKLDLAWTAAVDAVRRLPGLDALPLVVGGRSSGARVACRTAEAVGAAAVVALAFPLAPPGRPERSRIGELLAVGRPTLVVQGGRDAFGTAAQVRAAAGRTPPPWLRIQQIDGADHAFRTRKAEGRSSADAVADVVEAVTGFLRQLTSDT